MMEILHFSVGRVASRFLAASESIKTPTQHCLRSYLQKPHHSTSRVPLSSLRYQVLRQAECFNVSPLINLSRDIQLRPSATRACLRSQQLQSSTGGMELAVALMAGVVLIATALPDRRGLQYPPLHSTKDSIRVLKLHPGCARDTIKCNLNTVAFSEKPEYEALSYAWGNSGSTKSIMVNGSRVKVKENLWQALGQLRHATKPRVLWIDSLCINQDDLAEKNRQVPFMAFIYGRAQRVVIWLGNHEPPPRVQHRLEHVQDWTDDSTRRRKSEAWKQVERLLRQLAHQEYWKRTWIIQEITMASNLVVCYGKESLTWDDFVAWVQLYQDLNAEDPALRYISTLEYMRQCRFEDPKKFSLKHLIDVFQDSFSSVQSDKIYAFLGMAYDDFDHSIQVDYGKSVAEVYRDVVRSFCVSSPSETQENEADLVYYSALVRRLLTRKAIQKPKRELPLVDDVDEDGDQGSGEAAQLARVPNQTQQSFEPFSSVQKSSESHSQDGKNKNNSTFILNNYFPGQAPKVKSAPMPEQTLSQSEEERKKEEEENSKKKQNQEELLLLAIGAAVVMALGTAYYYLTRRAPDVPKEWHWQASEPEDLKTWTSIHHDSSWENEQLELRGRIAGHITHVGPSVHAVLGSRQETKHWTASLASHFPDVSEFAKARGLNEKMLQLVYDSNDLQTRNIGPLRSSSSSGLDASAQSGSDDSPRLFAGSNTILGLVPPDSQNGDVVVQFWNSRACAVVREMPHSSGGLREEDPTPPRYELIGRASIVTSGTDADWDVPRDKRAFGLFSRDVLNLNVTLDELTRLSLDTVNLDGS
ncbi:unnamed protein product [Periconia digitata]|uniref:Heterokaryon incompatibility domain-containing protein n=1 Tax=Periconia digitata TaxID=1303443 RepID=A0A9W4UCB2_9PLEO|nr:unnamed protein product [Periconia digitata]